VILVDTSAWIEFFRGRGPVAEQVDELIETDEATLCGPVVTELRRGLRSRAERNRVLPLLSGCHVLDQPANMWEEAGEIGWYLGQRGSTVKSLDLLIAAYALAHDVPILTVDRDFERMRRAGLGLLLVEAQ
jgi:predicted nucleic acid-binding protein